MKVVTFSRPLKPQNDQEFQVQMQKTSFIWAVGKALPDSKQADASFDMHYAKGVFSMDFTSGKPAQADGSGDVKKIAHGTEHVN
jgi:hypothetical protein